MTHPDEFIRAKALNAVNTALEILYDDSNSYQARLRGHSYKAVVDTLLAEIKAASTDESASTTRILVGVGSLVMALQFIGVIITEQIDTIMTDLPFYRDEELRAFEQLLEADVGYGHALIVFTRIGKMLNDAAAEHKANRKG